MKGLRTRKAASPTDEVLDVRAELRGLRAELAQLNRHRYVRMHNSVWQLMGFNLLRGLAFGLGTVLGASVLLSFLIWSLSQIEFLPIIGEWAAEISRQMEHAVE